MPRVLSRLVLSVLLGCAGCATESTSVVDKDGAWQIIGSWSGRGNAQLETFTVEKSTWRVRWETKNETAPGTGILKVTANSGDSGRERVEVLDVKGVGKDIEYISESPYRYYLVVTSSGIDWTLIVEEPVQ